MGPYNLLIFILSLLLSALFGNAIQYADDITVSFPPGFTNISSPEVLFIAKRDDNKGPDPSDMSWINRWAAVGDSFTAGIGTGDRYDSKKETRECSRYSLTYPSILQRYIGAGIKSFEYKACSSAKSRQIGDQIDSLTDGQDLIILTAGGNDLCLSNIITDCVVMPLKTKSACLSVIAEARRRISDILKPQIRALLEKMKKKMNKDGVIIWALYAEYFNEAEEPCSTKEDWTVVLKFPLLRAPRLTAERRKDFNQLVRETNSAIQNVVEDWRHENNPNFIVDTVDWGAWVKKEQGRQYCDPKSTGLYPDPLVPDLHFYKPSSAPYEAKLPPEPESFNETFLAEEDEDKGWDGKMDFITCDGDDSFFAKHLPDGIGKWFHPNELGHVTIASFVMEGIISARSKILGVDQPVCQNVNRFECKKSQSPEDRFVWLRYMKETAAKVCQRIAERDEPDWSEQITVYEDTPEEHTYTVTLSHGAKKMSSDDCMNAFETIATNCKEGDYHKHYGGIYQHGGTSYEISVMENGFTRAKTWQSICEYTIKPTYLWEPWRLYVRLRGAGWATNDFGNDLQWTMKKCMCRKFSSEGGECEDLEFDKYNFTYFPEPIKEPYPYRPSVTLELEWELNFVYSNHKYPEAFDECMGEQYHKRTGDLGPLKQCHQRTNKELGQDWNPIHDEL